MKKSVLFLSGLLSFGAMAEVTTLVTCNIEANIGKARITFDSESQKYNYDFHLRSSDDKWTTFFSTDELVEGHSKEANKDYIDFINPFKVADDIYMGTRIYLEADKTASGEGEFFNQITDYRYAKYYLNDCIGELF